MVGSCVLVSTQIFFKKKIGSYKGEGSIAHTRALSQALCDMRRVALDEARGAISSGAAFETVADKVAQQLASAVETCADGPLK